MARRKKVTLWDSTIRALSAMEQALEVFHGKRVRLVGTTEIDPGMIAGWADGRGQAITVSLETAFVGPQWYPLILSVLSIELVRVGETEWEAERAHFHITDPHRIGSKGSYYWAHWRRSRVGAQKVRVSLEYSEDETPQVVRYWHVGHDMTDRVIEQLIGQQDWPDWK